MLCMGKVESSTQQTSRCQTRWFLHTRPSSSLSPRVVLAREHRRAVEQVEDVEVDRDLRDGERERFPNAQIERRDGRQAEVVGVLHNQDVLAAKRIARRDLALEERLDIALA